LRDSRDFRLLFASRTVTLFGTEASEVALLVQARQLTGSAFAARPLRKNSATTGNESQRERRKRLVSFSAFNV